MTFSALGLSPAALHAVQTLGYDAPTPVQRKAIPAILGGRDVLVTAQTGTGKTAAFVLPIVERLRPGLAAGAGQVRALILTPTRELAQQVESVARDCAQELRTAAVLGGVAAGRQLRSLAAGIDLLVATPGRLIDLQHRGAVDFSRCEVLVLDEADRLLDLGFRADIQRIAASLPPRPQTLMFSATLTPAVRDLASSYLTDPLRIEVDRANAAAITIEQRVYPVDQGAKADLLVHLVNVGEWRRVLVFTRTREGANRLCAKLQREGIDAAPIHSDMSQGDRNGALEAFAGGKVDVLVATDVAARGLDIKQLRHVVNFDLPARAEDYVHRIGRAGRAGAKGWAHSFVSAGEAKFLRAIEELTGRAIARKSLDGFGAATALAALHEGAVKRPRAAARKDRSGGRGAGSGRSNARGTAQANKSAAPRPASRRGGAGPPGRRRSPRTPR